MNKAQQMKGIMTKTLEYFATHENVRERRAYKRCLLFIKTAARKGRNEVSFDIDEDDFPHRRFGFCIHAVVERLVNDGFQVALIEEDEYYKDDKIWTLEVRW